MFPFPSSGMCLLIFAVLAAGLSHAAIIQVQSTDQLAPILLNAGDGDLIYLKADGTSGTTSFPLDQPVTITQKNLTIQGDIRVLPSQVEIVGVAPGDPGELCPGNKVEDPGFEEGADPPYWIESPEAGAVITQDAARAHAGDAFAWFRATDSSSAEELLLEQDIPSIPPSAPEDIFLEQDITLPAATVTGITMHQVLNIPDAWRLNFQQQLRHDNIVLPSGANAILSFWFKIDPPGTSAAALAIRVGTEVLPPIAADLYADGQYHPYSVTLPASLLGATQSIVFSCPPLLDGGPAFYVDQVAIEVDSTPIPISNADFELGSVDWVQTPGPPTAPDMIVCGGKGRVSDCAARFGGFPKRELAFDLWIPASGGAGTGTLWVNMGENNVVWIKADGNQTTWEGTISTNDYSTGFTRVTVPLDLALHLNSPTPDLEFHAILSDPIATVFLVDNVCLQLAAVPGCAGFIDNADFELGNNNDWTITTNPPGIPVIVDGAPWSPGNWVAKFGGLPPPKFSCQINIPLASGNGVDSLKISLGGEVLGTIPENSVYQGGFALFEADLSPSIQDGTPRKLQFHAHITGDPKPTKFYVDDVAINAYGGGVAYTENRVVNGNFDLGPQDWTPDPAAVIVSDGNALSDGWAAKFGGVPHTFLHFLMAVPQKSGIASDTLTVSIGGSSFVLDPALYGAAATPVSLVLPSSVADGSPATLKVSGKLVPAVTPTIVYLDEFCIAPGDDTGVVLCASDNVVVNGDLEAGLPPDPWTAHPTDLITNVDVPSGMGTWAARFAGLVAAAEERSIEQTLFVPSSAELSFYLHIPEPLTPASADDDALRVYVDLADETHKIYEVLAADTGYRDDYGEVKISIPAAYANDALHTLIFKSAIFRNLETNAFYVDDLCLHDPAAVNLQPVLEVADGASLKLKALSVRGGSTGILVYAGGKLDVTRSYIHGTGDDGIHFAPAGGSGTSAGSLVSSVVWGCGGNGFLVESGAVVVFQSTFLDNNGTGINVTGGNTNVAVSLFYGNGGAPMRLSSGALRSYANYVDSAASGAINIVKPHVETPPSLVNTPWMGKLAVPLVSNLALSELATLGSYQTFDFENQTRSQTNLQVGADEADGFDRVGWLDCIVTPTIPKSYPGGTFGVITRPYSAAALTCRVTVWLTGIVGTNAQIIIKPQLATVAQALEIAPLVSNVLTLEDGPLSADFVIPGTFYGTSGGPICLDGLASICLKVGNDVYYNPDNVSIMEPQAQAGSLVVIDTVPPILSDNVAFRRAGLWGSVPGLVDSNDDNSAPPGNYPRDWPGIFDQPSSYGTLEPYTSSPQVFLNPDGPLDFSVYLEFDDPPAVPDIEPYSAGFWQDFGALPLLDSTQGFSTANVLAGYQVEDLLDAFTQYPDLVAFSGPLPGTTRWIPGSAALGTLTPGQVAGNFNATGDFLGATWNLLSVPHTGGPHSWHTSALFEATDLAGNLVDTGKPLHIWSMRDPKAVLTSGPDGIQTADPIFSWQLDRDASETPSNAAPCEPIAQFQLWSQDNETGAWKAETGWSVWTREKSFDRASPIDRDSGLRMGDILDKRDLAGAWMMLRVRGADEAGNLQALSNLDGMTWLNSGVNLAVDTTVQQYLWYNKTDGDMRIREEGERAFGSATRIPLPPETGCERIEVQFTITASAPEGGTDPKVYFELLEDSRLVASGMLEPFSELIVPEDLLNPPSDWVVTPFLNPAPPKCPGAVDRLGDEGPAKDNDGNPLYRRRDVDYLLTVQTVWWDNNGVEFRDPTPASARFTVYVTGEKKTEQPIKVFTRE